MTRPRLLTIAEHGAPELATWYGKDRGATGGRPWETGVPVRIEGLRDGWHLIVPLDQNGPGPLEVAPATRVWLVVTP